MGIESLGSFCIAELYEIKMNERSSEDSRKSHMLSDLKEKHILLILVMFAAIVFLATLNFNGVFVDEEYYISTGRLLLSGSVSIIGNPLATMFGFYIGPVIFAISNYIGGLFFVRFVSSLFVIGSLVLLYLITKELFHRKTTSVVAFLMALSFSSIFFLGRFAALDTPALFFTTLALYLLLSGLNKRLIVVLSSFALFIAFLTNYITLLAFVPMLLLVINNKKYVYDFVLPYIILVASYLLAFNGDIQTLILTKLYPQAAVSYAFLGVVILILPYVVFSFFSRGDRKTIFIFYSGAAIFLLVHLILRDYLNAYKHAAFAFVFLAPFAADGFVRMVSSKRIVLVFVLMIIVAITFASANYQAEHFFANEEHASQIMDSFVNSTDFVLADCCGYRYYTNKLDFTHIATIYWFDYNNDNVSNRNDYVNAVRDKVFRAIMTIDYYIPFPGISMLLNESDYRTKYTLAYEENQTLVSGVAIIRIYVS